MHTPAHVQSNRYACITIDTATDEGISGTSTKHRLGFTTMVNDAMAGKFTLIVTKSVSRFARNTVDSLTKIRKLKEAGCELFFEKENIWTFDSKGELLITIMSSLAQEESRSISENCTWGQRKRMSDGKVAIGFKNFLGYKKGEHGEMVIDEDQAKVVKEIYALFLQGMTPHSIANRLMDEGIPSPTGKENWYPGTVKSILTNEKYKGDALMQKYYVQDFLTKKKIVNRGEIPQYYVEGDHEAIISPETFELVQSEMKRRDESRDRYSGIEIFASRIVCGECGGYFGSKVWHSTDKYRCTIYRCNRKYDNRKQCNTPHVTEEQMKELFLKALNRLIAGKEEIINGFSEATEQLFSTKALEEEKGRLESQMAVLAGMIENAIKENAYVAKNQKEYQEQYGKLSAEYNLAKNNYDKVTDEISRMKSQKAAIDNFMNSIKKLDGVITEFDPELWGTLLDHATVNAKDDIRFTFRNGAEIKA